MNGAPLVSVVMAVYNGEMYLEQAVESILGQTFGDFEFIIINDGSTDGTAAILRRFSRQDARISVYEQENKGLIASLNRGCQLAQGKYIARMDADDISLPERFERQVQFMEGHPEIGVLGTRVEHIDEIGERLKSWPLPTTPGMIEWCLMFWDCVAHPSVLMRRAVVEQACFYRLEALHVEDYDLWARAIAFTQIANLPEVLLHRRVWGKNICSRFQDTQEKNVVLVMDSIITRLVGDSAPPNVMYDLRRFIVGEALTDLAEIKSVALLIRRTYNEYTNRDNLNSSDAKEIARDAARRLGKLGVYACRISPVHGLVMLLQALRMDPRLLLSAVLVRRAAQISVSSPSAR